MVRTSLDAATCIWPTCATRSCAFAAIRRSSSGAARNESDPAPPAVDLASEKSWRRLDPTRLYHPQFGRRAGRAIPAAPTAGGRRDRFYTFGEAFKTEIGSVSIPTLEAIHAMMPAKDWETVNDDWAEHDLSPRRRRTAAWTLPLYPDIIAQALRPGRQSAGFCARAQLANYEDFRAMYEGRFAKLFNPCTGVLTWMSNPGPAELRLADSTAMTWKPTPRCLRPAKHASPFTSR